MRVHTFPVGSFQCNCTILLDEVTREAIVIDPGDEPDLIVAELERLEARPSYLAHTHAHLDHVQGTRQVKERSGGEIALHRGDLWLYEHVPMQGSLFGFRCADTVTPDLHLEHGDILRFGSEALQVLHTPGHTPGSLCFLHEAGKLLFSGDTLFRRSIGRTDLWGGSHPQILESIHRELLTLDDDICVVAGHGPNTTIAEERRSNPFLADHPSTSSG